MNRLKTAILLCLCLVFTAALLCGCGGLSEITNPNSKVTELSGVMTPEEIAGLDQYENLSALDLSGSRCYDAIEAYITSHPQVAVRYTVALGDKELDPALTDLTLDSPAEIPALLEVCSHLKALRSVTVAGGALSSEEIAALKEALPDAALSYSVTLLGQSVSADLSTLDLSGISSDQVARAAQELALLPALSEVKLSDELPLEDFMTLKEAAPQAHFDYRFTLYGQQISADAEELSFSHVEIGDEGLDVFYRLIPCLDQLRSLRFERIGAENEVIDELRQAFPDVAIDWLVLFGWHQCWSDADTLWAIGGFSDEMLAELKYCTKLKYVDIGHNGFKDLSFVEYLPDLEVLILENDDVSDLSPLVHCQKLEYLEAGETQVTDVTPLGQINSLQHLNIGGLLGLTDISPLYGLTNLKRLYGLCDVNVPREQVEYIKSIMPDTEIDFDYYAVGAVNGSHWRYDENGIVPRYQLLHDQMGYGIVW